MLLFSTILDIRDTMTHDDFIQLAIDWNQGSPHQDNVIPGIVWNGERNIRFGDERLWMDINEYRNQNIIAIRYEKAYDDGAVWDTDYVMNFNEMRMSIQLDRSFKEDALSISADFSTPHFITLLIERGYVRADGNLPVLRSPMIISEDRLEIISNVITGESRYQFPVVYISKTYFNEDPVNTWLLAGRLKGMAHVLVQESKTSNNALRHLCDDKNEYNGAIGIYYPNVAIGHRRYLYHREEGYDEFLFDKVLRDVIRYNNTLKLDNLYTWQGVNNALLSDRLTSQRQERIEAEKARKKAEIEKEDVYATFDSEIEELEKQVAQLTKANESLRTENYGLRNKLAEIDTVPILCLGDEDEFFPGEIKEIVLNALEAALAHNTQENTRRAHIIRDIIDSNDITRTVAEKRTKIKTLLKTYNGLGKTLRQELMDMGFEITEDGKHYKLIYFGDGRYSTALAKTPSDHREGKNAAAEIIGKMM